DCFTCSAEVTFENLVIEAGVVPKWDSDEHLATRSEQVTEMVNCLSCPVQVTFFRWIPSDVFDGADGEDVIARAFDVEDIEVLQIDHLGVDLVLVDDAALCEYIREVVAEHIADLES